MQTSTNSTLAVITQLQPITVIFPLPEDQVPDILPQLNAGKRLQVFAFDRANVNQLGVGELYAIDSQVDTTTGMVKFRASFENNEHKLFPNQFVNAQLLVRTLRDVVRIPNAAIQRARPGAYAWVMDAHNKVAVRTLALGPTEGDMTAGDLGRRSWRPGRDRGHRSPARGHERRRRPITNNLEREEDR